MGAVLLIVVCIASDKVSKAGQIGLRRGQRLGILVGLLQELGEKALGRLEQGCAD